MIDPCLKCAQKHLTFLLKTLWWCAPSFKVMVRPHRRIGEAESTTKVHASSCDNAALEHKLNVQGPKCVGPWALSWLEREPTICALLVSISKRHCSDPSTPWGRNWSFPSMAASLHLGLVSRPACVGRRERGNDRICEMTMACVAVNLLGLQ
jgi:hypothetical protein